jgi:hypothetical protein
MRRPALRKPRTARIGDNGGPPLEEKKRKPAADKGEIGRTFDWRFAHRKAWKKPREIALRRQERAEALGLTYEEYTLEVLERGYFPQAEHVETIVAKRSQRRRDGGVVGQSLKGMRLKKK